MNVICPETTEMLDFPYISVILALSGAEGKAEAQNNGDIHE